MDAARIRLASPNGAGLRPITLAEGPIEVVDHLAVRTAGGCPYGLGATCPLVEITKGRLIAQKQMKAVLHGYAICIGLATSVGAVVFFYY